MTDGESAATDPREAADLQYQELLEQLQRVRRSVADIATSRKRIELQVTEAQAQADKLRAQIEVARDAGQDDVADEATQRLAGIEGRLPDLRRRHDEVAGAEAALTNAARILQTKVEEFRTEKELFKSLYSAGEAGAIARNALTAAEAAYERIAAGPRPELGADPVVDAVTDMVRTLLRHHIALASRVDRTTVSLEREGGADGADRAEIERLRALLRRHGIDPDEPEPAD